MPISQSVVTNVVSSLKSKYPSETFRIERCVPQTAILWQDLDGGETEFRSFCIDNFIADQAALQATFKRIDRYFEELYGNFNETSLALYHHLHLDTGEILPIDRMFGQLAPDAHITEDLFSSKIAFVITLNFPRYTLDEKTELCADWTKEQWGHARLGDHFASRLPAELNQEISKIATIADTYIAEYNIIMNKLYTDDDRQLFPEGRPLIIHWGIRDELKSRYADPQGLEKQRMIYRVMRHIVEQTIPKQVINNSDTSWKPYTNTISCNGKNINANPETTERYEHIRLFYEAQKKADGYYPLFPTYIKRRFDMNRELSADQIMTLFDTLMRSPVITRTAKLIEKRLNRPLEPFDIWYDGFKPRSTVNEDALTEQTQALYPDTDAFEKALAGILKKLGFSETQIAFIAPKVQVDASRGAGHAWRAGKRSVRSHLRTRIGKDGMDYKGFNIAVHEFGHNVEQTLSMHKVPYSMLSGVPFTAFTEAFAFVFQHRDLELLGITGNDPDKTLYEALDALWMSYEIMGVAVMEYRLWEWLYTKNAPSAADIRDKALLIAKEVWNTYYAPVIGCSDEPILAIYSHMIDVPLYLSDYPLGHIIEFQIEQYLKGKYLGAEMERMCALGSILPQEWMRQAVGSEISVEPLLQAAATALDVLEKKQS